MLDRNPFSRYFQAINSILREDKQRKNKKEDSYENGIDRKTLSYCVHLSILLITLREKELELVIIDPLLKLTST